MINYEFDDLFRYCDDPVKEIILNFNHVLQDNDIQDLAGQVKVFLDKHRKGLPSVNYPISTWRFYFKAVKFIFANWNKIFVKNGNETIRRKEAKEFWRNATFIWLAINAVILFLVGLNIFTVAGLYILPFAVLVGIFIPAFWAISYRSIVHIGRAYIAWKEGNRKRIAVIKNWDGVRLNFDSLWDKLDAYQQNSYFKLIENLYQEYKLNDNEEIKLHDLDLNIPPSNNEAQDRIKNWMNKFYQTQIPQVNSWQEVKSVTVQVSSLDEKFYYHWNELTNPELDKDQVESIIVHLKKVYADEWKILMDRLSDKLTGDEKEILLSPKNRIVLTLLNPQAIREIEDWANLHLQTLFNTLEGARKIRNSYLNLAKKFFPDATDEELESIASRKVQILFLHDVYPKYAVDSIQKSDIDSYLARYPFIQILWPEDLIHQSKYGAWANALSRVKGEFLLTLDGDHSIRDEDVEYTANALKEFTANPNLTGVQFKLYVYNEPFSITTRCVGLAENSWWGLDLRVKDKLGATGLYGHLIFRTEFLKRFEV